MKYLILIFIFLQGCDASNIITKEQWDVVEVVCKDNGGIFRMNRAFNNNISDIYCNSGAVFEKVTVPHTFYGNVKNIENR